MLVKHSFALYHQNLPLLNIFNITVTYLFVFLSFFLPGLNAFLTLIKASLQSASRYLAFLA